jgi:D-amino-acid oxidase
MNVHPERTAVVVGGGIAGLASAWCLRQAGWTVRILERDEPRTIASNVAAALWHPFAVGGGKTDEWALDTFVRLMEFARDPQSGVVVRQGLELKRQPSPPPAWAAHHPDFRLARLDELPVDRPAGFVFSAPVAEMGLFLPWLRAQLQQLGVSCTTQTVTDLHALCNDTTVVVNCTGLGARQLAGDASLVPWRGSVLRVEREALESFTLDDDDPLRATYIIPRTSDCVLGGSVEPGIESLEPEDSTLTAIRARCAARVPSVAHARLISTATHLRPWRPTVRLEAEDLGTGGRIVHNYGHGGAGVTLAFGCGAEVVRLASAVPVRC